MSCVKPSRIRSQAKAGTTTRTAKLATSAPGRPRRWALTLCSWSGRTKRTSASEVFPSVGQVPNLPLLLIQLCSTEEFQRLDRHDLPALLFPPQLALDHFPPVHHRAVRERPPILELQIESHGPLVSLALVLARLPV